MAPSLKNVAGSVAISVGMNALGIARDVAAEKNFKEAALRSLKRTGGDVLGNVFQSITGGGSDYAKTK